MFLKKDIISIKLLNKGKTIAEVINAFVKPTKLAKNIKVLLMDINRQWISIAVKSQKSD